MTASTARLVGTVRSGDVEIFFRRFGKAGEVPVLILHGANYYDSADWIEIAADLADDREVVTYDYRGYGESSWSPDHDYSLRATLVDIQSLLAHLGWSRAVFIGHSRGGLVSLRAAQSSIECIAALVLVDYSPGQVIGRPRIEPSGFGFSGAIYRSLRDAHAATSRNPRELDTEAGLARSLAIFGERDGGWVNVKRDPEFQSEGPADKPYVAPGDPWDAFALLAATGVPIHVVRGTQSTSYDESSLSRLRMDFGAVSVSEIESGHDIPGAAPDELVITLRDFLASHGDDLD